MRHTTKNIEAIFSWEKNPKPVMAYGNIAAQDRQHKPNTKT